MLYFAKVHVIYAKYWVLRVEIARNLHSGTKMAVFMPIFICFDGFNNYIPHISGVLVQSRPPESPKITEEDLRTTQVDVVLQRKGYIHF